MIRFARHFALCFFLLATAAASWSQTVRWDPPTGTLAVNQTSEIQLVFDGCEPKEEPAVPPVAGLQVQSVGQSSNMSIVNGVMSQTVTISFHVRPSQRGTVTLPEFTVNTNKGPIRVASANYAVGDATVGQGNVALDSVASSKIDVPQQVWAGEVFKVEYVMNVGRRYFHSQASNPEWNSAPLAIEEWSKPEVQESIVAGEPRISILYRTRGYAKQAGQLTLNTASQLINLSTGTQNFGFFARPNLEQFAITSPHPTINVRELPAGAPASFAGAVGQFKLESKIVPASSTVGEPITWTLGLNGTGNWPDITGLPSRDVSRDFRVVQPQARRAMREGSLFDGSLTEDVVLIPTQPGTYTLGPVTWSYFDPSKGQYQTVTTEKVSVTVTAPPPSPTNTPPSSSGATNTGTNSTATGTSSQNQIKPTAPPAAPPAIPRDALPGTGLAPKPWSNRVFALALLAPVPLLLAFWLILAGRRAQITDPFRRQREAQTRLRETIRALSKNPDQKRAHALLQDWQRDVAILWQLQAAVPAVQHFAAISKTDPTWAKLWSEAERALYRADTALAPDWTTRAEAAVRAKSIPRFTLKQLFRGHNLLPFAAALVLTLSALPQLHAEDGKAAYDKGDFEAAEATWRKAISENSTDWIARHNLALALAQQSRWGEAVGYAASAFVQHPNDASVQWHLSLTGDRAGFSPGSLGGFLNPSPLHSLARLFSPAEWQRVLAGAVGLGALGLAAFLLQSYGYTGRWSTPFGLTLLGVAIATGVVGTASLGLYQETRDTRSALVWKPTQLRSIPTEADTTQKTSPLAPGSIALIDKTFLGWARLAFPNGQTGWVRQEDLVRFWE